MPKSAHRNRRDHYVYVFTADYRPFYVGIGRSERASDRIRWVKSQIERQRKGLTAKWARHTEVIAECLKTGVCLKLRYLRRRMTRREALVYEREAIARYLSRGVMLANLQHNPDRARVTVRKLMSSIAGQGTEARRV